MEGRGIFGKPAEAAAAKERLDYLDSLTPEEALRYKCFVTSKIPAAFVEAALADLWPPSISDEKREKIAFMIGSATKAFGVQLCESAKEIADAAGHSGPLAPGHLFEAYRRLAAQGMVAGAPPTKEDKGDASTVDIDAALRRMTGEVAQKDTESDAAR